MKCLLINGTPHKGNTWTLAKLVQKRMEEASNGKIVFEEIFLNSIDLPFCKGCYQCFLKGEEHCPHYAQLAEVTHKIAEADGIIFAVSSYSLQIPAVTKNFIDHLSYFFHRPRHFQKKLLVVSTATGSGHKAAARYVLDVCRHWGFNRGYQLAFGLFCAYGYQPTEQVLRKLNKTADRFCKDLLSKQYHSPNLKRLMMYNVWRALSRLGDEESSADRRYWQESGMVNLPFSAQVPLGWFKRGLGNSFYRMMLRFFPTEKENKGVKG